MKSFPFRVLVIDEDSDLLETMTARLSGHSVKVGNRRAVASLTSFLVEVEDDGTQKGRFTDGTIATFNSIASKKFDLIVIDYAYAAPGRQAKAWNEDGAPLVKERSNAHLLRLSDLRDAFIGRAASRREAERFFTSRTPVVLRSLQHDRQFETLGPFSDRLSATRAIFPLAQRLYPVNGFELIYGGEKDLRDRLYHKVEGGRSMYRHTITNFTRLVLETAMLERLAKQANQIVVFRGSAALAILLVLISIANAIAQPFIGGFFDQVQTGQWLRAFTTLGSGLLVIVLAAVLSVLIAEFALHRFIDVVRRPKP
jgi:hypothetical protein